MACPLARGPDSARRAGPSMAGGICTGGGGGCGACRCRFPPPGGPDGTTGGPVSAVEAAEVPATTHSGVSLGVDLCYRSISWRQSMRGPSCSRLTAGQPAGGGGSRLSVRPTRCFFSVFVVGSARRGPGRKEAGWRAAGAGRLWDRPGRSGGSKRAIVGALLRHMGLRVWVAERIRGGGGLRSSKRCWQQCPGGLAGRAWLERSQRRCGHGRTAGSGLLEEGLRWVRSRATGRSPRRLR